jgi:Ca-activated chloride channel family protein
MLIAQMDAAITPLSTMTKRHPELEARSSPCRSRPTRAPTSRAPSASPRTPCAGCRAGDHRRVRRRAGRRHRRPGPVQSWATSSCRTCRRQGGPNAAITNFSVRRYPLDKSRYEVMLEVTNTATSRSRSSSRCTATAAHRSHEAAPEGEGAPPALLPEPLRRLTHAGGQAARDRRTKAKSTRSPTCRTTQRLRPLARAAPRARPGRHRRDNMYLEAALLLDEYLDVTTRRAHRLPGEGQLRRHDLRQRRAAGRAGQRRHSST